MRGGRDRPPTPGQCHPPLCGRKDFVSLSLQLSKYFCFPFAGWSQPLFQPAPRAFRAAASSCEAEVILATLTSWDHSRGCLAQGRGHHQYPISLFRASSPGRQLWASGSPLEPTLPGIAECSFYHLKPTRSLPCPNPSTGPCCPRDKFNSSRCYMTRPCNAPTSEPQTLPPSAPI